MQWKKGSGVLNIEGKAGEKIKISARGSKDPDKDKLNYHWWVYQEPSTYTRKILIQNHNQPKASIVLPEDAKGKIIHVILEVTDSGKPELTRYRRIIISVQN